MDINSSGTGAAEDDLMRMKDESEIGDDANHSNSRVDSRTS